MKKGYGPYFAKDKGKKMQSPIIQPTVKPFCNISMDTKGQWNMQTNITDQPTIIGILSMMINSLAGNLAKQNSMLIDPNKPRVKQDQEEPVSDIEVKPNGNAS